MHVDWDWVKQRPHFIAELLSSRYQMKIIYLSNIKNDEYKKARVQNLKLNDISYFRIIQLPLRGRLKIVGYLNDILNKLLFVLNVKLYKPDIVWLTSPLFSSSVLRKDKYKVVYDCMDDAAEFSVEDSRKKNKIIRLEKDLIKKSDIVFCSSNNLLNAINDRIPCKTKAYLVRNAYGGDIINLANENDTVLRKSKIKIGYIGTISSWFDFDVLVRYLEECGGCEFHLFGPNRSKIKINVPGIIFHGPVNHSDLYRSIIDIDCLIMPFKLNRLVESVDPVKLYEYINFNKPVVSVYYKEVERFSDFVYFYSDYCSFMDLLKKFANQGVVKKYSLCQRKEFLLENSWLQRGRNILDTLAISES